MNRILVVNHAHSSVCGIHALGGRLHDCLVRSTMFEMGYAECSDGDTYRAAANAFEPDVIIVNYRADLTPWSPAYAYVPTFAVAHQYEAATIDAYAHGLLASGFDYVLALDPDIHPSDPRVFPVGRPIPETVEDRTIGTEWAARVGSFGFAFPHKGFATVAAEINAELDEATYELHMPEAFFNGAQGASLYTAGIVAACEAELTKPGVHLHHTSEHLLERELVMRLAANDVNCLFYAPGQPDAGLSSAIDYLVAARRPIFVTDCAMFRHVRDHVALWPATHLSDIFAEYAWFQEQANNLYHRMAGRLMTDVEHIVAELRP
jgi:hypothetical protein